MCRSVPATLNTSQSSSRSPTRSVRMVLLSDWCSPTAPLSHSSRNRRWPPAVPRPAPPPHGRAGTGHAPGGGRRPVRTEGVRSAGPADDPVVGGTHGGAGEVRPQQVGRPGPGLTGSPSRATHSGLALSRSHDAVKTARGSRRGGQPAVARSAGYARDFHRRRWHRPATTKRSSRSSSVNCRARASDAATCADGRRARPCSSRTT